MGGFSSKNIDEIKGLYESVVSLEESEIEEGWFRDRGADLNQAGKNILNAVTSSADAAIQGLQDKKVPGNKRKVARATNAVVRGVKDAVTDFATGLVTGEATPQEGISLEGGLVEQKLGDTRKGPKGLEVYNGSQWVYADTNKPVPQPKPKPEPDKTKQPKPKPEPDKTKQPKPEPDKTKQPKPEPAAPEDSRPALPKPAPAPAPARPAPQASPVAQYMKAAAAARKSGDPAEMAKVRDMGLQIWASTPANKKLAAAAAERERIRGTAQTDNPLMKDMRSRLPLTPSVQSPTLKKDLGNLAPNYTRLTQNPNAAIAATPKPATTTPAAGSALAGKQTGTAFSGTALSNAKPVAAPNMSGGTVTDRTPVAYSSTLTQTKGSGLNPPSNTISDTKSQVLRTGLLKKGDPGWENKERYNVKNSYEYDAYDLVLEYLLSEGHADTVEEAHYVMLQMNAEHIRNIVEGFPTIQGTLNPWEDPKTGKSGIKIKSVDKSGTTKEYGPLKGGVFIKQAQTQKKPTTQVAHFEPEGEVIDERLIDKLNQKPWK